MKKDFIVNVNNNTKGVSSQGFGLVLVFDHENEIPYMEIGGESELTDLDGVTVDSRVYKLVQKIFMAKPGPTEVAVFGTLAIDSSEIEEALNSLLDEQKNDWFTLTMTDNSTETLTRVSKWALANDKLLFSTTQDIGLVEAIESPNTAIGYHEEEDDFFAEGLASNMAMALPGSITAKFEEVQGSLPSTITLTELNALHKENGFSYIRSKGRNYVSEGKMTDGTYIDITLGSYFIKFRLEEALFLLAMNNGKIPYSDKGIAMIVAEVETILKTATRQGIILEENGQGVYKITALRRNEMLKNDIANRVYDGVSVTAVVAGAIHSSEITINLVLSEEE